MYGMIRRRDEGEMLKPCYQGKCSATWPSWATFSTGSLTQCCDSNYHRPRPSDLLATGRHASRCKLESPSNTWMCGSMQSPQGNSCSSTTGRNEDLKTSPFHRIRVVMLCLGLRWGGHILISAINLMEQFVTVQTHASMM